MASVQTHCVHPGGIALALRGERLETLLGSCVSVILADPRCTVAAMCHIVHSRVPPSSSVGDTAFAAHAMRGMFSLLQSIGFAPGACEARVYGGGNMFPHQFSTTHVGSSNVRWVMTFLQSHGIHIVEQSTGGACYRTIRWTVGDAPVQVRTVTLEPAIGEPAVHLRSALT